MQAYVMTRYGDAGAMEVRDVPEPVARDGEVLIRVRAAGLNPIDYKIREGKMRLVNRLDLPQVAGSELSGVVEGVGAGVTRFAVGDRVFARVDKKKLGAYAAYAVVHETMVAKMPESLDFADAAGLPLAGLTALQALRDELGVATGDRVFISGGAGGVGTLAIQLAVWMGAEVATTASPRGEELVRSLGATTVINYQKQKFKDVLSDYDGAFDLTGGQDLPDSFAILKRGAKTVSIGGVPVPANARVDLDAGPVVAAALRVASARIRRQARQRGVGYRYMFMHPSGEDLNLLAGLVDKGTLKAVTDRVFPFEQIAEGFAYLEQGRAKGKVVVQM
ncbi:NADP-dependent oxidoreductase [Actinacidiphila oryziradicis]|uniref:NADP-dependent oxidoreductase n=1 Tax=Actinacidiphila oryziradicis TaxID=2571141 RepID=A0A4U0ST26_9ACTN|nr:NADP-dependent oxidoreductase [Actinacidiphila oryziradicis]TKA13310.1 NADP-dependent oxidoreductase [Actinacidiphila oryziradicis]